MGYSFRLTTSVLLYAPSHRQDSTYHSLCYTSCGALAGTRNNSMGPPHEGSIRQPIEPWANALTTELHLAPHGNKYIVMLNQILTLPTRVGDGSPDRKPGPVVTCSVSLNDLGRRWVWSETICSWSCCENKQQNIHSNNYKAKTNILLVSGQHAHRFWPSNINIWSRTHGKGPFI